MCDLSDSASCDSDIFVVKQIKPVNKLTLKQALIIKHTVLNSFHSRKSKKKKKKKKEREKLGTESQPKKKADNGAPGGSSFNEKCSVSPEVNKEINILRVNKKNENFQDNLVEIRKKNNTDSRKNKEHSETYKSEILPKKSNDEILSKDSLGTSKQCRDSSDDKRNKGEHLKKRVELSSSVSPERKRLKISSLSCTLHQNEVKKPLSETPVKVQGGNSSITKESIKENASEVFENFKFEEFFSHNQLEVEFSEGQDLKEKYRDGSELLCYLFKKIVRDETKKQIELEEESCMNGKVVQKLFSEDDCEIFEKFFNLEDSACKLFVRMLSRKKDWHRISTIAYDDIGGDLKKYFDVLKKVNFIDTNIDDEDFKTQLNLLTKPEIRKLCRLFNVFFKSQNSVKKEVLINALVMECQKQKSVLEIIKGINKTSRLDLLKSEVKNYLGMCIRINNGTFRAFNKILILFSFAHYFDEEGKRFSNELYLCLRVYRNIIKFPNYTLSPSIIFETRADLEEYEASLMLLNDFEVAVSNKNHEEFLETVKKVKESFKNILKNDEYKKRFLNLPSFLKKFSAGTVYARILTKYCQTFKKKADQSDIKETVNLLLGQDVFLTRKRGDWYELLSKALEGQRENNEAAKVIVKSLEDPGISEVQRLTLQLRGQGILKKKSHGVTDVLLKELLDDMCTVSVQEPASIEIKGKALEGNECGFKCVYVQDTDYGKKYLSVEERAITYYKSHGYTKGYHVEGYIIQSVYFLLFFDIIYGISPKGVFQSPYQEVPLDFYSALFYVNRKDEIDKLLADMLTWDDVKIETTLRDVYLRNYSITCVISWNDEYTPELFCEVIKCITMPVLVLIFQRFIQNFRVYRSGFPDLTLWNPETNKIKFVEVKSPNDKLSPGQRIWLNYLRSIGLSAEVCNVKNSSALNFK